MSSGIPVTDEIQGNLNIRDFSGTGLHGNLLVEHNLTVLGTITGASISGLAPSGDTTGATDTAAIQGLWNLGANAVLGIGDFYLNATLNPKSTAMSVLTGAGWGTVVHYDATTVSPAIGMGDTTQRRVVVRDLRLANSAASAAGTAINMDYFTSSTISNVLIDGITKHPNIGISLGTVSTNTHYNVIKDCRIQVDGANAIGIELAGGASGAISNIVRNCRILISATDATNTGIVVATRSILLDHVDIESSAGIAVDVQSGGDVCTLLSPYLESNGTNLKIASGVISTSVFGGTILTATTTDVADSGTGTKILGVRFTGGVVFDSAFLQQNAAAGRILRVVCTSTGPTDSAVRFETKNAAERALGVRVTGDAVNRVDVRTDRIAFGGGAIAADVLLQRNAAGRLDLSTTSTGTVVEQLDPYLGGAGFLAPTGAFGESIPRQAATVATAPPTTSGTVYLVAIYLPAGVTIGHISMVSGTGTLKTGGQHGWYVLADSGLVVRDATADQTDAATVWGTASTVYTLATTAGFVTTYAGLYYVGIMVANSGGSQPNMVACTGMAAGITGIAPKLAGPSTGASGTGQTTPPATDGSVTLGAISAPDATKRFYAWVT